MVFNRSKINGEKETVAEIFKSTREDKGLSLEDISNKLGISSHYLKAIEDGAIEKLPEGVYGKTFIKKYSSFLNIDENLIKSLFENKDKIAEKDNVFKHKKIKSSAFLVFPKIFRNIMAVLVVLAIFFYIGIYLKKSLATPEIEIYEPKENLITDKKTITIKGSADVKTQIEINNRVILKKEDGSFSQEINLKQGLNKISISAQNKYSKKKIIERQILVK